MPLLKNLKKLVQFLVARGHQSLGFFFFQLAACPFSLSIILIRVTQNIASDIICIGEEGGTAAGVDEQQVLIRLSAAM